MAIAQDKPSWFWRRTLVFLLCLLLVLIGAVAVVFNINGSFSDVALAEVMGMIKIVLPAIAVAYIGGAVWDDANYLKKVLETASKAVLNPLSKMTDRMRGGQ